MTQSPPPRAPTGKDLSRAAPAPGGEAAGGAVPPADLPPLRLHWGTRSINRCQADDDGCCAWEGCPQNREGEPWKSGRHCPLDVRNDDDD